MLTVESKDEEIMKELSRVMQLPGTKLQVKGGLYGDGKNLNFAGVPIDRALREKRAELVEFLNNPLHPHR